MLNNYININNKYYHLQSFNVKDDKQLRNDQTGHLTDHDVGLSP